MDGLHACPKQRGAPGLAIGLNAQEEKRGIAEAALQSGTGATGSRLQLRDLFRLFGLNPRLTNANASSAS